MRKLNIDPKTVDGFGDEWSRFDQSEMFKEDTIQLFNSYFSIFPFNLLPPDAEGFDLGCGSGRWARILAPQVGKLHCIDPSIAIDVAKRNLQIMKNCEFHKASVEEIPLPDRSMDFGYSLGVLHHIPDTQAALISCVEKLKPGAPFLIYLYYKFDNRPFWYKCVWKISDLLRLCVSRLPYGLRYVISQIIALLIYWPLAKFACLAELLGVSVSNFPLSHYRHRGFYVLRTDALDRFGTRLELRFSKVEILHMMEHAGLERVVFSELSPFWCAVGFARHDR